MLSEALVCGLVGGIIGASLAWGLLAVTHFELSVEGFSFAPSLSACLVGEALLLSALLATAAGFLPARRVARMPVAEALREVD
jgi:ABC-type antimicrobial peptide transport system permease subunit